MAVEQLKVTDRVRADAEVPLAARSAGGAVTNVLLVLTGAGAIVVDLGLAWTECMVQLRSFTSNCAYIFSDNAAQVVNYAYAAANPPVAAATLGQRIMAAERVHVFVPYGMRYLAIQASGTGELELVRG